MPERDTEPLFVGGWVVPSRAGLAPIEIRRGMPMRSRDGGDAGQVAAVMVDSARQAVTHIVLSRWRAGLEYRLVPAGAVIGVRDGAVVLELASAAIDDLPARAVG
jgi:hypothetical protein